MTDPKDLPYTISHRETIAEAEGLRVQILTLDEGEAVPWHYHSRITDTFICLYGALVVETRAPRARHELAPGERLAVPPKTAHEVRGKDGRPCRFVIVQGVGAHDFVPVGGPVSGPVSGPARSRPRQDERRMKNP